MPKEYALPPLTKKKKTKRTNAKEMTLIQKKIKEKYHNSDELIALIIEFQLEEVIKRAIQQIETKFQNGKITDLPKLSGIILNDVNSCLARITDSEKKKKVEYLLSDIFQGYLNEISKDVNAETIFSEIQLNIQTACEYRGYDYDKLSSYINIQKHQILLPKSQGRRIYYDWNGELGELDELAKDLYDMKIIYSVKEFKRLFKPISGNLSVRCNHEHIDKLIILFQVLKNSCLITPRGRGNSGHFAPLVQYSVDNDGIFLFKKSANKIHERIKRDKSKYHKLKAKMGIIVRANAGKSIRQRKDNGHCPSFE